MPHTGYLQTISRLVAIVAQSFPMPWSPTIFAVSALMIQALPPTLLMSERMEDAWPDSAGRLCFAFLYVALPNSFEVLTNLTNAQWHLATLAFLIVVIRPSSSRLVSTAEVIMLTLSGLSGPFAIFLLPIALWQTLRSRTGASLTRLLVLTVCACIQIALLIDTMAAARLHSPLGAGVIVLARIVALQIILGASLGIPILIRVSRSWFWSVDAFPLAITAAGAILGAIALRRGNPLLWKGVVFAALLFGAALISPVVSETQPQWLMMTHPIAGNRYYLIPMMAWMGILFVLLRDPRHPDPPPRRGAPDPVAAWHRHGFLPRRMEADRLRGTCPGIRAITARDRHELPRQSAGFSSHHGVDEALISGRAIDLDPTGTATRLLAAPSPAIPARMSWLTEYVRPKIRTLFARSSVPDNLWHQCPACQQMIFHRDLAANRKVCPHCGHHMRASSTERLDWTFDENAYTRIELPKPVADPLRFRDTKRYADRLKEAREKTHTDDAITVAHGTIGGQKAVIAVMEFDFIGGSMGAAVGDAIVAAARLAALQQVPLIVFTASGGARMQEGAISLMQMPRTVIATRLVKDAGLPFIVVLTDPTTGGVTASFAMLGDIQIAEPGAMIGFAGARVIEQTVREKLPEGFQRAEYLLEHGIIDMVVKRTEMKATLARIIGLLARTEHQAAA